MVSRMSVKWDEVQAERYEKWFQSEEGSFAYALESRLLKLLVSRWPRRGQKLLEIGCGPGIFLELFWEVGFDVYGIDASPAMLKRARRRLGKQAVFHQGHAEHLPFEDKEYDFSVMITVLEFSDDPAAALAEACRVARKGVLVAFLNRNSLYYLLKGKTWPWAHTGSLREANWFTCRDMRGMLVAVNGHRPMRFRSVLPGPPSTWRNRPPWNWLNGITLPGGLGAFCAVRADFTGEKPFTPLYAFKTEAKPSS
jgi:SAM-dependent methyltransferase